MKPSKNTINILLLLCIGVITYVFISFALQLPLNYLNDKFVFTDATSYLKAAQSLYTEGFRAHSVRPYGWPVILGLPYLTGATDTVQFLKFSLFLNFIFWMSSIVLTYNIVRQLSSNRIAFVAAFFFIFSFTNILATYQAITENFFIFILLLFTWFFLQYITLKTARSLLIALFFLCFSVVVRPITLYFSILFLVFCVIFFVKKKDYKALVFSFFIFGLTIGTQLVIMHKEFGKYTISFIQNYTLDTYLITKGKYLRDGKVGTFGSYYEREFLRKDSIINAVAPESGDVRAHWLKRDAVHKESIGLAMNGGKKYILIAYIHNMLENCRSGAMILNEIKNVDGKKSFDRAYKAVKFITTLQNKLFSCMMMVLSAIIIIKALRKRANLPQQYIFIVLLTLITGYLFLTSGISFWQNDRFSIVWYPLFIICAAYTYFSYSTRKKVS